MGVKFTTKILILTACLFLPMGQSRASDLVVKETLSINHSLWGEALPNAVKGIAVAYDEASKIIYTSGITSPYLMLTHVGEKRPFKAIDLGTKGTSTSSMLIDKKNGHLIWVGKKTGSIRVIDLKTHEVLFRHDSTEKYRDRYPVKDVALDEKTGWILVANTGVHAVEGYSPDLQTTSKLAGIENPFSIAGLPNGKGLLILDAASREEMVLYRFDGVDKKAVELQRFKETLGHRPPKAVQVTQDGMVLLMSRWVTLLDDTLQTVWTVPLPEDPKMALGLGDGSLAFLLRDVGHKRGTARSAVVFLNRRSGGIIKNIEVGFEASFLAWDAAGKRLFVGNGGDGSVSVIDLETYEEIEKIDVANAAEGLVVDDKTGTRYILNRLGGSEIYAWQKNSNELTRIPGGNWPSELAIDVVRRRLFALSHYDSAVFVWDLDSLKRLDTVSLDVSRNTGDSLGDFDYDPKTGLAAAVFPEHGDVVVVDMTTSKVLWKKRFREMSVGNAAGPGQAGLLISAKKNRLYVYSKQLESVQLLDLKSGNLIQTLALGSSRPTVKPFGKKPRFANQGDSFDGGMPPKIKPPKMGKGPKPFMKKGREQGQSLGYAINNMYLDEKKGRFYLNDLMIEESSFTVRKKIEGVKKIFYVDDDKMFGLNLDSQGQESLVVLDPKDQTVRRTFPLAITEMMRLVPTYDAQENLLYISNLALATVTVYEGL